MFYLFPLENLTTVGYVCLFMIGVISTILMRRTDDVSKVCLAALLQMGTGQYEHLKDIYARAMSGVSVQAKGFWSNHTRSPCMTALLSSLCLPSDPQSCSEICCSVCSSKSCQGSTMLWSLRRLRRWRPLIDPPDGNLSYTSCVMTKKPIANVKRFRVVPVCSKQSRHLTMSFPWASSPRPTEKSFTSNAFFGFQTLLSQI